jgi:hypothetical protein
MVSIQLQEEGRLNSRETDLMSYVLEGIRRVDGKGNEDDVCFGVCEGSQSLVVLLTGGIPQSELH